MTTKKTFLIMLVALLVPGGVAFGEDQLMGFDEFISSSGYTVQSIEMLEGDNLMIVNPDTGIPEVVSGKWHVGFLVEASGGYSVVGYAENTEPDLSGYEGWLQGKYTEYLGVGNFPDEVWIVNDGDEDGIGIIDSGTWIRNPDDILYTSQDILFGPSQVRGDLSQLPAYTGSGLLILPEMTIDQIPEPATLMLFGVGGLAALLRRYL